MQRLEENQSKKRLKILIIAAAANPEKGSEPGLGWGWIEALSKYHDLWVITGEREGNREAIERRFKEVSGLSERLKIYYISRPDGPYIERIWLLLYYRHYRQWHQKAFQLAEKLNHEVCFDLVHQLNMTGFREPGYLWQFNLPFVWGPVGGTANVPLRFASILGASQFIYHLGKVALNNLQLRYHGRVRKAVKGADGFVTSTSDTRTAFLRVLGKDSVMINDNGPPLNISFKNCNPKSFKVQSLRLAWSGLHISRKALPVVLRALAILPRDLPWQLDIIGAGPMTQRWRYLANKLGIDTRCIWHGWLKKDEAINIVSKADIFLFPSLHESTPAVIFEAMSMGVPVICLDHCGQADVITEDCGIKIAVTSPKEVIQKFSNAIAYLVKNPDEIERLSKGALKRVEEFSWDKKAQKMLYVYQDALLHWRKKNKKL